MRHWKTPFNYRQNFIGHLLDWKRLHHATNHLMRDFGTVGGDDPPEQGHKRLLHISVTLHDHQQKGNPVDNLYGSKAREQHLLCRSTSQIPTHLETAATELSGHSSMRSTALVSNSKALSEEASLPLFLCLLFFPPDALFVLSETSG